VGDKSPHYGAEARDKRDEKRVAFEIKEEYHKLYAKMRKHGCDPRQFWEAAVAIKFLIKPWDMDDLYVSEYIYMVWYIKAEAKAIAEANANAARSAKTPA
jgi:hypothetical protein